MAIDYNKKTWGTYAWNDDLTVAQNVAAARNANALIESSDLQRIEDAVDELAQQEPETSPVVSVNDKIGEVVLTGADINVEIEGHPDPNTTVQTGMNGLGQALSVMGEGLTGGNTHQVLTKVSEDAWDYTWANSGSLISEGVSKIVALQQYEYDELPRPLPNDVLYVIVESGEPAL